MNRKNQDKRSYYEAHIAPLMSEAFDKAKEAGINMFAIFGSDTGFALTNYFPDPDHTPGMFKACQVMAQIQAGELGREGVVAIEVSDSGETRVRHHEGPPEETEQTIH